MLTHVRLLFLFSFVSVFHVHAQEQPSPAESPSFKGLIVYGSFSGPIASVSINLEHRILYKLNAPKAFLMAGFGTTSAREGPYYAIPLGINFLLGNRASHLDFGGAFLYNQGSEGPYAGTHHNKVWSRSVYFFTSIGYRYQRPAGGFFFRIYYAPGIKVKEFSETDPQNPGKFYETGKILWYSLGLGAGYYFNKRN